MKKKDQEKYHLPYKEADMIVLPYDRNGLDAVPRRARGVYVLIDTSAGAAPVVAYVGRGYVRSRLKVHLTKQRRVPYFGYRLVPSKKAAFRAECDLYHRYGKRKHLRNRKHPERDKDDFGPPCTKIGCNGEP